MPPWYKKFLKNPESANVRTSDGFELKFPKLRWAELKRFWAEPTQAGVFQFLSWNQAGIHFALVKNYIQIFKS